MNREHTIAWWLRRLLPLWCVLGGAGCAHQPVVVKDTAAASAEILMAQRQRAGSLQTWQARGRIAVRRRGAGWRGQFDWKQTGRRFHIRLSGVLGGTLMIISGESGGTVTAVGATGWRREAGTPEQLIRDLLDVDVPVSRLRYWMAGAPAAGARPDGVRVDRSRLMSFIQDGWQVRYTGWNRVHELPEKIGLSRRHGHRRGAADDTMISLSIASWTGVVREPSR